MQGSRRDFLSWTAGSLLLLSGCQRRGGSSSKANPATTMAVRAENGQTLGMVAAEYNVPLDLAVDLNPKLPLGPLRGGTTIILPRGAQKKQLAPIAPTESLATTEPFELIPRQRWGAAPMRANYDPMNGITRITIHHTSELPGMTTNHDRTTVLNIQRLHQGHGWADIGYHFLIGRDGKVYEGRKLTAQGAHAGNNELNQNNLGIALIGDFMVALPTAAQLEALKSMMGYYQEKYRVPINRVYGHRDLKPTLCPGDRLYSWLNDEKRRQAV